MGITSPRRRVRWHHLLVSVLALGVPCIGGCASPAPNGLPSLPATRLSLDDLVGMARAGQSPETLIARIRDSGAYFRLSANEVISLHQRGLPMPVIDHILAAERRYSSGAVPPAGVSHDRPTTVPAVQDYPAQRPLSRPIPALYQGV